MQESLRRGRVAAAEADMVAAVVDMEAAVVDMEAAEGRVAVAVMGAVEDKVAVDMVVVVVVEAGDYSNRVKNLFDPKLF